MHRTFIILPKMNKPVNPKASRIKRLYKFIKRNTYGRVYNMLWDKTIILFVCPISKRIVPCGPKGKGYEINIPTYLLRIIAPTLKWGLLFMKLALASQGLVGIVLSLEVDSFSSSPVDLDYLTSIGASVLDNSKRFITNEVDKAAQNMIDALDNDADYNFSQLNNLLGNTSSASLNAAYDNIYNLLREIERPRLSYGATLQQTGLEMVDRNNTEYLWVSKEEKIKDHYITHGLDPNNPYMVTP
mmetsp:Transcript_14402/g.13019  ORF Transcript_14402/g.13019 Transcript_14402/m.13019 type:complete len:243 (+) Transcript_14402:933-1661(+)